MRLMLTSSSTEEHLDGDDEDDWVIDTYANGRCSIVYEEDQDDRSIYSQDSFVEEDEDRGLGAPTADPPNW